MSTKRLDIALPGLPKLGFYISMLLLPGGFIGLLLVFWMERRAGQRQAQGQGNARMWYAQIRGWRDVLPGLWRMMTSRPQLALGVGKEAAAAPAADPAMRYLSA